MLLLPITVLKLPCAERYRDNTDTLLHFRFARNLYKNVNIKARSKERLKITLDLNVIYIQLIEIDRKLKNILKI